MTSDMKVSPGIVPDICRVKSVKFQILEKFGFYKPGIVPDICCVKGVDLLSAVGILAHYDVLCPLER